MKLVNILLILAGYSVGAVSLVSAHSSATFAQTLENSSETTIYMGEIVARAQKRSKGGTIAADDIFSKNNLVDNEAHVQQEVFDRARTMLAHANHEILIQTYWFDQSEAVSKIYAGLKELENSRRLRAAEPVQVRFVINSPRYPSYLTWMYPQAVKIITGWDLDPKYVSVKVKDHSHLLLGMSHSKSIVVDGQIAMVMGANIQAHLDADGEAWYDLGFTVAGPVVHSLRNDFIDLWTRATGEPRSVFLPESKLQTAYPLSSVMSDNVTKDIGLAVLSRLANGFPNNSVANPQDQGYLAAFAKARTVIKILSPNFNDDAAIEAVAAAAKRGVEVRIVTSLGFNDANENLIGQGGDNVKGYARIRKRATELGADAGLLKLHWYSHDGKSASFVSTQGYRMYALHAKYASVDGTLAIVGSANMDTQSWNQSRELNIAVENIDVVRAWDQKTFDEVFARSIDSLDLPQ